jgi:hypothetical protein
MIKATTTYTVIAVSRIQTPGRWKSIFPAGQYSIFGSLIAGPNRESLIMDRELRKAKNRNNGANIKRGVNIDPPAAAKYLSVLRLANAKPQSWHMGPLIGRPLIEAGIKVTSAVDRPRQT